MKATTDKAADGSSVFTRLDTIRMSKLERRHAYASLRDGELIAELVLRAVADLRAIARCVEHAAVSLASGIKAMLAKPAKHRSPAAGIQEACNAHATEPAAH